MRGIKYFSMIQKIPVTLIDNSVKRLIPHQTAHFDSQFYQKKVIFKDTLNL